MGGGGGGRPYWNLCVDVINRRLKMNLVVWVLSTQCLNSSDPLFLSFSLTDRIPYCVALSLHSLVKKSKMFNLNPLVLPTSSSRKFDRKDFRIKADYTSKISSAPILFLKIKVTSVAWRTEPLRKSPK